MAIPQFQRLVPLLMIYDKTCGPTVRLIVHGGFYSRFVQPFHDVQFHQLADRRSLYTDPLQGAA
jgi:hypothetical protein